MLQYMLDTNICIYVIKNYSAELRERFNRLAEQLCISSITLGELHYVAEKSARRLQGKGYSEFRNEGLVIAGWPVQFLPVASDLDAEARARAEEVEIGIDPSERSVATRVLRPEHIVATALRIDRPRDRIRIIQFLEEQAVDVDALCGVVERHALRGA